MPIALALKFGDTVKPLIDCRLSSPFGNGASTVSGHTDAELFQVWFCIACHAVHPQVACCCLCFVFLVRRRVRPDHSPPPVPLSVSLSPPCPPCPHSASAVGVQSGYSPLPEDLALFKMDKKVRFWLKWGSVPAPVPAGGVAAGGPPALKPPDTASEASLGGGAALVPAGAEGAPGALAPVAEGPDELGITVVSDAAPIRGHLNVRMRPRCYAPSPHP
jgi:hypothetical protein